MKRKIAEELDCIFKPKSIAVIGASDTSRKWGYRMVENPLKTGFKGAIYPINPRKREILGLPTYPSVSAVPDGIDLNTTIAMTQRYSHLSRDFQREEVNRLNGLCGENGKKLVRNEDFQGNETQPGINATA